MSKANLQKPSRKTVLKFLGLVAILLGYFAYLSFKFDVATGGLLAILSWSFFVLCTPVADAGFLLDFPLRLIAGIRMMMTEIFVWVIAISVNTYAIEMVPDVY